MQWQELITGVLIGATTAQLAYWLMVFSRLARYEPVSLVPDEDEQPVSVVICARNEAKNLQQHLPHILNQNNRSFEVVVVNDNSTDETWVRLLDFQKKYSNLTLVNVPIATPPGKKAALSYGIAIAKHDLILLCDADCIPASPEWIRHMQSVLHGKTEIGLGFSPYLQAHGFLNVFIRFEAIYTAVQYLSFALAGRPYMGVGRNLIYRRSLFQQTGGFKAHGQLASGDDDLFINAAATRTNTAVMLHPESFVFSKPKTSWRGYYNQKSRHLTTGTRYRLQHQLLLGGLSASHFLHYLCAIWLLAWPGSRTTAIIILLVRMGVVTGLYWRILPRLGENHLKKWIPLLDALFVLYYLLLAPVLIIGNKRSWKQ